MDITVIRPEFSVIAYILRKLCISKYSFSQIFDETFAYQLQYSLLYCKNSIPTSKNTSPILLDKLPSSSLLLPLSEPKWIGDEEDDDVSKKPLLD